MPHQTPDSSKATAQNQATEPTQPNDQAREQHVAVRPEPSSYAAHDVADSTLAPPAAGEVGDFADEGDALDPELMEAGFQQGRTNNNEPDQTDRVRGQGPKTREANKRMVRSGSADQGTH